jgi:hypothetical protein
MNRRAEFVCPRLGQLGDIGDNRVQLRVERADSFDGRNHDLGTRKPPIANARCNFERAFLP